MMMELIWQYVIFLDSTYLLHNNTFSHDLLHSFRFVPVYLNYFTQSPFTPPLCILTHSYSRFRAFAPRLWIWIWIWLYLRRAVGAQRVKELTHWHLSRQPPSNQSSQLIEERRIEERVWFNNVGERNLPNWSGSIEIHKMSIISSELGYTAQ